MTKRVNDATIAHAAIWRRRWLGNKRGSQKVAVADTAERYGVSEATVRKALRSFKGCPAPSEAFKPFFKK
jgi:DNA-binding GntR family transcriptional regulator